MLAVSSSATFVFLTLVSFPAVPSSATVLSGEGTKNGCQGEIFPTAADAFYLPPPDPDGGPRVDRLAISLQEYVSWEQTTLTKWSHVRKLLVQHQGEDFWELWKADNEARELVTLSRLWQELRIGYLLLFWCFLLKGW